MSTKPHLRLHYDRNGFWYVDVYLTETHTSQTGLYHNAAFAIAAAKLYL